MIISWMNIIHNTKNRIIFRGTRRKLGFSSCIYRLRLRLQQVVVLFPAALFLLHQQRQYLGTSSLLLTTASAASAGSVSRALSSYCPHSFRCASSYPVAFFFHNNKNNSATTSASAPAPISNSFISHSPSSSFIVSRNKSSSIEMAHMDSPSAQRNKGPIWSVLQHQVPILMTTLLSSTEEGNKEKDYVTLQVLEIAAGVGVHTVYFASQMLQTISEMEQKKDKNQNENKIKVNLKWYPTDPDVMSRFAIGANVQAQEGEKQQQSSPSLSLKECIHLPALPLTLDKNGIVEEQGDDPAMDYNKILQSGNVNLITCINMIHISPWEATIGLFQVASQKLMSGGILYCYGPYKENGTAVQSNLDFDASLKARNSEWGVRDLESVLALANENGLTLQEKIEMPANNLSLIFRKD